MHHKTTYQSTSQAVFRLLIIISIRNKLQYDRMQEKTSVLRFLREKQGCTPELLIQHSCYRLYDKSPSDVFFETERNSQTFEFTSVSSQTVSINQWINLFSQLCKTI